MTKRNRKSIAAALAALCLLSGCQGAVPPAGAADGAGSVGVEPAGRIETMAGNVAEKAALAQKMALALRPAAEAAPDPFVFMRENFPVLDGSVSAVPLGQAAASVLLGEGREAVADLARFSGTARAYRALLDGSADVILAAEPSRNIWDEKEAAGFAWDMAPLALDALVFAVSTDNPVENLTVEQARGIYTGAITNWAQVGGEDRAITAFQRADGAGSQTAMLNLVMDGEPMAEAPAELVQGGAGGLMEAAATWDGSPGAIGYTGWYAACEMHLADGLKLLSIDGVYPSAETIRSGEYPLLNGVYVLTASGRGADDPAKVLFDWLLSADGRRLAELQGCVVSAEPGGVS